MPLNLYALTIEQAVDAAQEHTPQPKLCEALDRRLRAETLKVLLDGAPAESIQAALADVALWAQGHQDLWHARWSYLLGLLNDAARTPSTAADAALVLDPDSRGADVLRLLLKRQTLPNTRLVDELGISKSQLSNLLKRLEDAHLIKRRKLDTDGRKRAVLLTARGRRVANTCAAPEEQPPAPRRSNFSFWHNDALARKLEPVPRT